MVQEVQKSIEIHNGATLDTIEAIGTSSRKIIEGRQTRGGHYASNAVASGGVSWSYTGDGRQSEEIQGSLNLSSIAGKMEFITRDGGVRVPQSGTYQLTIYWRGGASSQYATIYIKAGGNTVYTATHTSNKEETVVVMADLGKFDLITLRGSFYYKGSAGSASLSLTSTITIQQL